MIQTSARTTEHITNNSAGARPRRVFFLVDSFMIGGTETQAVELALRLDPAKYEVTVGCLRKEGPLLEKLTGSPLRIVEVDLGKGIDSPSGILGIIRLARYLRREKFEILHAHDLWSNMVGMAAATLARTPVRITSQRDLSHDAWYSGYKRTVLRFLQRRSSVVVANAKAIRDGLVPERIPLEKTCVIYNGVDIDRFEAAGSHRSILFPSSEGLKLIVMVGNMISDVKGHSVLIAAAPEIISRHPHVRFVLVGEGPRCAEFEAQVANLGLGEYFLFLGRRSDVPEILAGSDIAVLPSLAEGLPNAVLEYLAAGLPVVASALGGNLEIIRDNVNGLLIPPRDNEALSTALLRLLDDPRFAADLARAGKAHVAGNFSFASLVQNVEKLYTALLQAKSAAVNPDLSAT